MRLRTLIATSAILFSGLAFAEDAKPAPAATPYPLDTCIVSGEKLGEMGEPVVKVHEGREVKFCCGGCIKKFDKDPARFISAMDAKAKEAPAAGAAPAPAVKPDPHAGHNH